MNLQPRKLGVEALGHLFAPGSEIRTERGSIARAIRKELGEEPSIWRMELPNTSYMAPVGAFWWVSNEKVKR